MSDIELKPCPFCGELPEELDRVTVGGEITYQCANRECNQLGWHTLDEWNTRPIEDALRTRLAIAVKALTEISNSTNEAYLTGGREMKRIARQAIAEIRKEGKE